MVQLVSFTKQGQNSNPKFSNMNFQHYVSVLGEIDDLEKLL
jgi:hypothetical protein